MKRLVVVLLLAFAACESQEPPAACGPIPQVTVNAGETATVTGCFDDPSGDTLVYPVFSNPEMSLEGGDAGERRWACGRGGGG